MEIFFWKYLRRSLIPIQSNIRHQLYFWKNSDETKHESELMKIFTCRVQSPLKRMFIFVTKRMWIQGISWIPQMQFNQQINEEHWFRELLKLNPKKTILFNMFSTRFKKSNHQEYSMMELFRVIPIIILKWNQNAMEFYGIHCFELSIFFKCSHCDNSEVVWIPIFLCGVLLVIKEIWNHYMMLEK